MVALPWIISVGPNNQKGLEWVSGLEEKRV